MIAVKILLILVLDYDDEAVDDRYQEELESWLSYYVEPEEE